MSKLSFVVIAKNESLNIEKCINAILAAAKLLDDHEIIFIDSGSTDGTLAKVKSMPVEKMKIIQITVNPNAPRARNLGAAQAQFECIFFIDGDVVIEKGFLDLALAEMARQEKAGCVFGQLEEIQYSRNFGSISKVIPDRYGINSRSVNRTLPGGIFLTTRAIYMDLHGMDERFDINQDREFGLRVINKYQIIALPSQMGTHHTVAYRDIYRTVRRVPLIRFIGLLVRKNIFSFRNIFIIIKLEYGSFLGMAVWFIIALSLIFHSHILLFVCLLILLLDLIKGSMVERSNIMGRLVHHYFYPIIIILSFLFFYPKRLKYSWVSITP